MCDWARESPLLVGGWVEFANAILFLATNARAVPMSLKITEIR